MKAINAADAPKAIGPYSHGYTVGNLVITSGQLPAYADGKPFAQTIEEQAEQSCANVKIVLEVAGTDFAHVVKTTCFLSDMNNFAAFNEVYAKYFSSKPARSCVAVKTLPGNALCEIEAIAEIPE